MTVQKLSALERSGESLCLTAQNLVEFHGVATRPKSINGLGMTVTEAMEAAAGFEARFELLADVPTILPTWKTLVAVAEVIGKQVHDTRLVAVCQVYAVDNLLTFNVRHFLRPASFVPGLNVVHPFNVAVASVS